MSHGEFLDELCRKRRLSSHSYLRSALADRKDEAVARWMVDKLFQFMAKEQLAYSRTSTAYARTSQVFRYWERDEMERVAFAVRFAGPDYLDVRVNLAGYDSFLMEIYDLRRDRPMDCGSPVGELRELRDGSGRIQIVTVMGMPDDIIVMD
jgi:hypothetical protein